MKPWLRVVVDGEMEDMKQYYIISLFGSKLAYGKCGGPITPHW